jgi:hypothetical protein
MSGDPRGGESIPGRAGVRNGLSESQKEGFSASHLVGVDALPTVGRGRFPSGRMACDYCRIPPIEEGPMAEKVKIDLTMYGIAEVIKWCVERNKGRIPGVDTEGFKKMQALLAERPQSGDYFTLDQFWKKKVVLELTPEEVATIDRCLYDIPNFENVQLPQIRHKFWPQQTSSH